MIIVSENYRSPRVPKRLYPDVTLGYFYIVGDLIFTPCEFGSPASSISSAYDKLRQYYPNIFRDVGVNYYPWGSVSLDESGDYIVMISRRYRYHISRIKHKLPIILGLPKKRFKIRLL